MLKRVVASLAFLPFLAAVSFPRGMFHLSPDDSLHLLSADSFTIFRRIDAIPSAVRKAFVRDAPDKAFAMATPGGEYQESCITHEGLPHRRLIFGALSADHCLLCYEIGGRGHYYMLLLFKLSGPDAQVVWHAVPDDALGSLEKVRDAVRKGNLDDDPAIQW